MHHSTPAMSSISDGCALVVEGDEGVAGVGRRIHGSNERMQQRSIAVTNAVHSALLRNQEPLSVPPQRLYAPINFLQHSQ